MLNLGQKVFRQAGAFQASMPQVGQLQPLQVLVELAIIGQGSCLYLGVELGDASP